MIALAAAAIGAWAVISTGRAPLDAERRHRAELDRRVRYAGCLGLAADFLMISRLADQARSTIKVTIAAQKDVTDNTRAKTILPVPKLLEDSHFMALLRDETARMAHETRLGIEAHNFDMRRAGGSFGDDNFQRHVQQKAEEVATAALQLSNRLKQEAYIETPQGRSARGMTAADRTLR